MLPIIIVATIPQQNTFDWKMILCIDFIYCYYFKYDIFLKFYRYYQANSVRTCIKCLFGVTFVIITRLFIYSTIFFFYVSIIEYFDKWLQWLKKFRPNI